MKTTQETVILVAEDDSGHARLIEKNLRRIGLDAPIQRFENGQDVIDFLFKRGSGPYRQSDAAYLLLLDIRMPKLDGVEVLRLLKQDDSLRKIPVIMFTTTDDPREIERCHMLGCSSYIVKPIEYDGFAETIKYIGMFVSLVRIPVINGRSD